VALGERGHFRRTLEYGRPGREFGENPAAVRTKGRNTNRNQRTLAGCVCRRPSSKHTRRKMNSKTTFQSRALTRGQTCPRKLIGRKRGLGRCPIQRKPHDGPVAFSTKNFSPGLGEKGMTGLGGGEQTIPPGEKKNRTEKSSEKST